MTKRERARLSDAVRLLMGDDPDRWDDAMTILCRLLNPGWRPPAPPAPTTVQELMRGEPSAPRRAPPDKEMAPKGEG